MFRFLTILATCAILCAVGSAGKAGNGRQNRVRRFPEGFLFGTSTASYQVEGGWNADGKSENIWDHLTHTRPQAIYDRSNGDTADDSYHLYGRDIEIVRELGLDFYRFSISWARLLPTSFPDKISEAGRTYYDNLINEALRYNITPMVTLYHWDLPQKLQDMGGWTNPHVVEWYADYARVAFELFGDRVKMWITINEPYQICTQGYGNGTTAPMLTLSGVADYYCVKNLLLAHATAYHIYDEEYRPTQNGNIFITFDAQWYEPANENDPNDVEGAEDTRQFIWGQYIHPVYSETGGWPPAFERRIAAKSAEQGFFRSRLPAFTPEEIEYVRGTSDFFGLNHYMTFMTNRNESAIGRYDVPSFLDDLGCVNYQKDEWFTPGQSTWIASVPWGFYKLLTKIREDYNNPPVIITENGYSTYGGLIDDERITYYRLYMDAMLDAMEEGSDVRGYTAWSMIDNFEWRAGYTERFGLYEVDYTSPMRTRTPRKSAFVYKEIVRTKTLDFDFEPAPDAIMTIDPGH